MKIRPDHLDRLPLKDRRKNEAWPRQSINMALKVLPENAFPDLPVPRTNLQDFRYLLVEAAER
jgi:hypothetical protein